MSYKDDCKGTTESEFRVGMAGGGQRIFSAFNGFLGRLLWTPTAARDITVPDQSGTIVLQNNGRIEGLSPAIANGQTATYEQIIRPTRPSIRLTISQVQIAPGNQSLAANTLRAFPWELKSRILVSELRQEVTTLIAATTFRLALYADNGSAYPGAIIPNTDLGTYDSATTGVKILIPPSPVVLTPGYYWLVVNSNGAPTLRSVPVGAIVNLLGFQAGGGTNSQHTGWFIAQAYGAMPANFPAGAALLSNIAAPLTLFTTS